MYYIQAYTYKHGTRRPRANANNFLPARPPARSNRHTSSALYAKPPDHQLGLHLPGRVLQFMDMIRQLLAASGLSEKVEDITSAIGRATASFRCELGLT